MPEAGGLCALNIDPEAAAAAYRERVVGPYRGILPELAVKSMEEQLSGACTVEIAAFDEYTKLLGDPAATAGFDHIIFDTALTGHTLRLLKLPAAWTGLIETNTTGTSCLAPLAGLEAQKALYDSSLCTLSDPVLVSRPEPSALAEAEGTRAELAPMGMMNQFLFLNGVSTAQDPRDAAAHALEARGRDALAGIPPNLGGLSRVEIPLLPYAPMGVPNLRAVFGRQLAGDAAPHLRDAIKSADPTLAELVDEIEKTGRGDFTSVRNVGRRPRGVVVTLFANWR